MICDFQVTEIEPGMWQHECQRDGCRVTRVVNRPRLVRKCNVVGLGDRVAWILNAVGIRVRKTCGCKKRQEALNKIGERLGL